jgi:hypothetical protein
MTKRKQNSLAPPLTHIFTKENYPEVGKGKIGKEFEANMV